MENEATRVEAPDTKSTNLRNHWPGSQRFQDRQSFPDKSSERFSNLDSKNPNNLIC